MQKEKSQPEGKGIMPETKFTEFPALSVDPRVEISRSASETDDCLFFLPMTLKIMIHHSIFDSRPYTSHNDLPRMSFGVFRGAA